ncbi:hypothetical protein ES332_A08G274800v1 [Gossypium tomentosum]|uniref:Uncharacterized protein n=1 Tax=Gossypium tomentosum TaxID=34277 RepID=A0A5D2PL98_GOSTO|nr:hypothetical protein ES332_A08G274800v1 [Gossypium tomentosum]
MGSKNHFHVIISFIFISLPFSSIALHVITPIKEFKILPSTDPSSSHFNSINIKGHYSSKTNSNGCFNKIYAFGDSYTDTGNAQLLNISKNLKKGQEKPNNGWLLIDFVRDALNISSLPPYKSVNANFSSGVNFAMAGATVFTEEFLSQHKINSTLMWKYGYHSFQTQIEWYNKFVSDIACKGKNNESCKADMENSLFWVGEIGIDDYVRALRSKVSLWWIKDMAMAHTSRLLATLLDSGAKYIVVEGLPPLGCYPFAKSARHFVKDDMNCNAKINRVTKAHNHYLQDMLEGFRRRKGANVSISYADYFDAYKVITGNLNKFGFEDAFKACCGHHRNKILNFSFKILCGMSGAETCRDPDSYIHWDGIHLTEAMYRQLSEFFLHGNFCKPSFIHLIRVKKGLLRA